MRVVVLCAGIFSLCLTAQAKEKLVFATTAFPPFRIVTPSGKVEGADADITRDVCTRAGYKISYTVYPLARASELLKQGHVAGFVSLTRSPERESYCFFSQPINSVADVFFKRKDREISWQTLEDLAPYVVGCSENNYAGIFLDAIQRRMFRRVEFVRAGNPELLQFRKLLTRRIDLFICEISVGSWFLKNHAREFSMLEPIRAPIGPIRSSHVAFSKRYPGAKSLVARFDRALAAWKRTPRQREIFSRYGLPDWRGGR